MRTLLIFALFLAGFLLWWTAEFSAPTPTAFEHDLAEGPDTLAVMSASATPPLVAQSPEDVRKVITFTRSARDADATVLRTMALESEDPLIVGNALRALGRLKLVSGDEELLTLVDDSRKRVRQEAVRALGLSRDSAAVAVLERVVEHGNPDVRVLCIRALGHVGGEEALAVLGRLQAAKGLDDSDKLFLRHALDEAAPRREVAKTAR